MLRLLGATAAGAVPSFRSDCRGSTATIFAFAIIPLCLAVGLVVDLSRARSLRTSLQAAADQAALAAVASAASGNAADVASAAAASVWSANLTRISNGSNSVPAPAITTQTVNGVSTASVQFNGTQQTSFSALIGVSNLAATGASTAQSYQTVTRTSGLSGAGSTWGDPHVSGADGRNFMFHCPAGNWYNLLSDSGLEVNISCTPTADGEDVINQFSVVLGHEQFAFGIPGWDQSGNPLTPFTPGAVTVNGTPTTLTLGQTTRYAGGAMSFAYVNDRFASYGDNTLTIQTTQYAMTLSVTPGNGQITITATGAGVCGVPGGIWGKTLAGLDDSSYGDFQVNGPTATTYEFQRSSCGLASLGPHIIQ